MPLVCEAFNWQHGTFLGSTISSEKTAAAEGKIGELRHDPFAMLPFCGYNMGDYFAHWFQLGRTYGEAQLPRIYTVNWFKKGKDGAFLWPGFGENCRVLKWIFERTSGAGDAIKTPLGYLPNENAIDLQGLSLAPSAMQQLLEVNPKLWLEEVEEISRYFTLFGKHLPPELNTELENLKKRLKDSIDHI